ncbi:hypothetical protein [Amycolatopsis sp. NPDC059021]|uniref:hypothetical protein n=1 Tax=Amycolatopsis sp. NPDC059021 TaxID=3346704 RepID=UPI00367262B8
MYDKEERTTEDPLGAVLLPRPSGIGKRNQALAGGGTAMSANPLITLQGDPGSPSVATALTVLLGS